AKAQYVKTSTGFGPQGATREVVEIMLATVDGRLGVKASGGIRTWHECVDYLSMGCTRIGVGDPLTILNGSPD
ncbi:MAG: 2-deoxyribose-5-phosphate aldolase, partial [Planctomycetaceae bacterium]|nr:2-deoxyribose-5-phosphate aldolase [Planctomycetaceae bacterium]